MGSVEAKVYRDLLKAVRKHVGKGKVRPQFTDFIRDEFRDSAMHSSSNHPSYLQDKLKFARDYTLYLNGVHHHKELLFSYNIAVDRSDEMKKTLGKSAASVGLQLPEVYTP